jgi:hypothetical protein
LKNESRLLLWTSTVLSCVYFAGCAGSPPPTLNQAVPYVQNVEHRVYLVGDAGKPAMGGEPVLMAVQTDIRARNAPATVVFLGDNLYRHGLPDASDPEREEMERRILDQVKMVKRSGADGIFVPGNHDWDAGGDDGWAAIQRQEQLVETHGTPGILWLPDNGCPGPETFPVGDYLQLVVIDTHWWLHGGDKPGPTECTPGTEREVLMALSEALSDPDQLHLVIGHHPYKSGGPHGGYFPIEKHIFPLRELASWAWLPLPIIGSAYPVARMSGISSQDQSGPRHKHMNQSLETVLGKKQHLAYATGHEHALEVLEDESVGLLLVSGGGYYGHTDKTRWRDETLFTKRASGFMRLDVSHLGDARLAVMEVDEKGVAREVFALDLKQRSRHLQDSPIQPGGQ